MAAKQNIVCINTSCKHNDMNHGCRINGIIGIGGECESFEKGFIYYIRLVWNALSRSTFIDALDLTSDLRIGLYYVMKIYNLGLAEMEWGTCRMFMLKDGEDGEALKYEDIIKRECNMGELERLYIDFQNGIIPGQREQQTEHVQSEKENLGFGWLSPKGDFIESPFGRYEESAEKICEEKELKSGFRHWSNTHRHGRLALYRDFLIEEKGYCLIHNPNGNGGYIVTYTKPLTKKQKEFLYEYFIDKGDRFKAEQYLE